MSDISAVALRLPSGMVVTLSADEYRLALLWRADFGGGPGPEGEDAWAGLELATTFVVDGPAKQARIHRRLRPLGPYLPALIEQVDALEMLAARYWFRNGPCAPAADDAEEDGAA